MNLTETQRKAKIRELNYLARTAMGVCSRVVQTPGIAGLAPDVQSRIREKVETFNAFTPDNDPYQENDMGSFEHEDHRVRWKIDYYDRTLEYGSEDPADARVTTRVLTIMLAEEY